MQDYLDVDVDDGTRVSVAVEAAAEYVIHQFQDYVGAMVGCYLAWNGHSTLAPSTSVVKLQAYNYDTTTWEDLDSDNATEAHVDFDLVGALPDLTDYKSPQLYVTCRVYQQDA